MRNAQLLVHQLRYEQRTFWRNPSGVFFVLGLPVTMLVIFTTLNSDDVIDGAPFIDAFFPAMAVFGLINATYGNLAAKIVLRRENGLLKRAYATPLPLGVLLAAMLLSAVVVVAGVVVVLMTVATVAYGAHLPQHGASFVVVMLAGGATFAALGILLAGLISRPEATDPVVYGTLLPLLFISGVFDQVDPDSSLARVADVFPVSHLLDAVLASTRGAAFPAGHLAVVAAWGTIATLLAARRFEWQPRVGATRSEALRLKRTKA